MNLRVDQLAIVWSLFWISGDHCIIMLTSFVLFPYVIATPFFPAILLVQKVHALTVDSSHSQVNH